MASRLSRRALARQAMQIQAQIDCAVRNLDSPDEHVRAEAVRQLCPCRTHANWTLERYVVRMRHDASALVRFAANFVLTEELEHEMVREARAAQARGKSPHFVWNP
jgi:hypothetical protein